MGTPLLSVDSRGIISGERDTSRLVEFVWRHDDGDDVRITGDFVGWGTGLPMTKTSSSSSSNNLNEFRIVLRLAAGSTQAYKFIVNGEWMYDPRAPFREDAYGNINNYIEVPSPFGETTAATPVVPVSTPLFSSSSSTANSGGGTLASENGTSTAILLPITSSDQHHQQPSASFHTSSSSSSGASSSLSSSTTSAFPSSTPNSVSATTTTTITTTSSSTSSTSTSASSAETPNNDGNAVHASSSSSLSSAIVPPKVVAAPAPRTPLVTGQGYIGAGVAREFHEEYGITVDTSGGRGGAGGGINGLSGRGSLMMPRSASLGDMAALDQVVPLWGRVGGKGIVSSGITMSRLRGNTPSRTPSSSVSTPTGSSSSSSSNSILGDNSGSGSAAVGGNSHNSSTGFFGESTGGDSEASFKTISSDSALPVIGGVGGGGTNAYTSINASTANDNNNNSGAFSPVAEEVEESTPYATTSNTSSEKIQQQQQVNASDDDAAGLSLDTDTTNSAATTTTSAALTTSTKFPVSASSRSQFDTSSSASGSSSIFGKPPSFLSTTTTTNNTSTASPALTPESLKAHLAILGSINMPRVGSSPSSLAGSSPSISSGAASNAHNTTISTSASGRITSSSSSLATKLSSTSVPTSAASSSSSSSSYQQHQQHAATSSHLVDAAVGIPVSIPIDRNAIWPHQMVPSLLSPSSSSSLHHLHHHHHHHHLSSTASTMTNIQALLRREGKLVLAMVGLPARGKTFMARRLKRHLSWMGYRIEIFNVGNYRRKYLGANQPHDFFDPANEEGEKKRNEMARIAFEEMVSALKGESIDIAVFDATNTTRERRRWLCNALQEADPTYKLVFIESICNDESTIRANVRETKLKSPDYKDMPEPSAVSDFLRRIEHYTTVYQPLAAEDSAGEEDDIPYIKLIDVGRQIIANRINGYVNSRIMFFLSNLHITPRPIWLTRHGESEYNVQGRIGGDSLVSPRGQAYSLRLAAFMNKLYPPGQSELVVWTSTLRRTMMTAAPLGREIVTWKALDEIDAGICDGMTYEAIAATMPEEYAARAKNKFTYRYPRGESYQDIVHRLEPVIIELMRQKTPVLIVSHQATLRVLYAYLTDKPPESCPDVLLPLHTVVQLTQKAYGAEEVRHELM